MNIYTNYKVFEDKELRVEISEREFNNYVLAKNVFYKNGKIAYSEFKIVDSNNDNELIAYNTVDEDSIIKYWFNHIEK